ncbi:MAG: patatin family protein, partial [Ruminococcus sp.]|nr:patatin family protein [Ruminococcus sp.]
MTGLVLEGGTFRGIFSAGVMDAFIEEGIEFPYIVGVSAGISNGASY